MRYFYLLCTFILFTISNSYSQVTSEKLPGLDGGNFFSVVEFQDTLYTITFDAKIFTSADNGASWSKDTRFNLGWSAAFEVNRTAYLTVDEYRDQLYVYGSFGLMIYSSGTITIPETLPEFFGSKGAFGEIVVSDSALYASYRYSTSSLGEIMKSTDGGVSWASHDDPKQFFTYLESTSDGKLLGASGKKLYLSESGGATFTQLTIPSEFIDLITDILVTDDLFYFSSLEHGIQSSTDEGANWTQVNEEAAFSLNALSDSRILAGGLNAHVYITSDAGANWSDTDLELSSSIFSYQGIKDVLELENGTIIATTVWGDAYNNSYISASPGMLSSSDGGSTWSELNSGLEANTLTQIFHDDSTGDIYLFSIGKGVHQWNAETRTWVTVGTPPDLSEVQGFNNAPAGWNPVGGTVQLSKNPVTGELVLVSKYVSITHNKETNIWEYVEHDPQDFLLPDNLYFTATGTAVIHEALGGFQGIYTSTDLVSWTAVEENPNGANISNFSAIDGYIAYFDNYAFDQGLGVHYSTDLGTTWTHIQEDHEGTIFFRGYFMDPVEKEILTTISGYPAPEYTLKSTIEVYDLETETTSEIPFSTSEEYNTPELNTLFRLPNGTIVGLVFDTDPITYQSGPIGYFYQSGETFKKLNVDLPEGAADEVTITGDNTFLLRYGADIYEVSISAMGTHTEEFDNNPVAFRILPNYPNPFNPGTQLQFELNQPSNANIVVYTMSGQVVKEIDMGKLNSGMHSVYFDASSLASGVYLYTVQAGSQLRTGKMTLIK
ncbi:MAG: T9SS type A sorting domain-containing protein [Balneolaceae bacterium]